MTEAPLLLQPLVVKMPLQQPPAVVLHSASLDLGCQASTSSNVPLQQALAVVSHPVSDLGCLASAGLNGT